MRITRLLALTVLSAGILAAPDRTNARSADAAPPPATAAAITAVVDRAAAAFLQNQRTVGLSIGVLQDGKEYTYHFGTRERGKTLPPTDRTRYCIASITKTFTGTLLAEAVVERRVRLDDDVRNYLDGAFPNLEYQGQPIRLWQLIDHTSGLPFNLPAGLSKPTGPNEDIGRESIREAALLARYTRDDFLRDLHTVTLTRLPGTKFSYSNAAAQLLGLVLERVYGKPYEEILRQKITGPLHMNDTKVRLTAAETADLPRGYSAAAGAFLPALSDRLPGAGSLKSTTADMLKYVAWNIAEQDAAVRLAHRPIGDAVWNPAGNFVVGLNWQILRTSGRRDLFQDGNVPGFHCLCAYCPELRLGIVVLSNQEEGATPTSLSPLIDQILQAIDPRMSGTP